MNHFILLVACFLSIELFIRLNYISLISSTIKICIKSINVISNKKISDHWKENIIPAYSLQIMKRSLLMLIIIFLITMIFFVAERIFNGLIEFIFSISGIIETILFSFSVTYIRKLLKK